VAIPVDSRDWDAGMPIDAPPTAKTLIERLKRAAAIMSSRQSAVSGNRPGGPQLPTATVRAGTATAVPASESEILWH